MSQRIVNYINRRRDEARKAGLCVRCWKKPPAADRVKCEGCLATERRAAEDRRRARGVKPAVKKTAADLRAADRNRKEKLERARWLKGLCLRCGKHKRAARSTSRCEACLTAAAEYERKKRERAS